MNSEILAGLDFFERDKGIKREVLLEAINNAVLAAARKAVGPARDLRVDIDSKSGDMKVYAKLTVVEKVENKHDEISFTLAKKFKNDVQLGEDLEVPVTPRDFGRIAAQTAKQAMMQRIRQAEKEMIYDEFKDRADRRSSSAAAIRILCAVSLKPRSAKSPTARWKSRALRGKRATGRRSPCGARTKKWTPWARASACAARA